jgi:hypothetical protein
MAITRFAQVFFRVWSETDLLWQIIDNDDIGALQKMLATRVTLRDAHTLGFNLLQVRSVVNDEFY